MIEITEKEQEAIKWVIGWALPDIEKEIRGWDEDVACGILFCNPLEKQRGYVKLLEKFKERD